MAKTMTQAQTIQRAEMVRVWGDDLRMVAYECKHSTPYMINESEFIAIARREIKTRFCFGYSTDYSGHEYEDAENLREKCANSVQYFRRKNMEELAGLIEHLKDGSRKAYKYIYYQQGERQMKIFMPYNRDAYERQKLATPEIAELTGNERAAVIAGYENEQSKLNKRLDTYLKRYGLSKLRTWTYWRDE